MSKLPEFMYMLKRIEDKVDFLAASNMLLTENVEKISQTLNSLQLNSGKLTTDVEDILSSSTKINEHIDFVNDVYDTVKSPFHTAMSMITWASGTQKLEPCRNLEIGNEPEISDDTEESEFSIGIEDIASMLLFGSKSMEE